MSAINETECPAWVVKVLNEAMDDLAANFTAMVKGNHSRVIQGKLVTMAVPYNSSGCLEVMVQDHTGRFWVRRVRVRDLVWKEGRHHVSSKGYV